jgi:hypothetical protein
MLLLLLLCLLLHLLQLLHSLLIMVLFSPLRLLLHLLHSGLPWLMLCSSIQQPTCFKACCILAAGPCPS